jgi:hypothetical protein
MKNTHASKLVAVRPNYTEYSGAEFKKKKPPKTPFTYDADEAVQRLGFRWVYEPGSIV